MEETKEMKKGSIKVCHLTSAHRRYDVRILEKQCVSLASRGYDVTLIVNDDKEDEIHKGVKILSTGLQPKSRRERFSMAKKLVTAKALEVDADLYQFHDPDLLSLGMKLKSMGKTVIFDSHEDVPASIKSKGWIPKSLRGVVARLYEAKEKKALRKIDAAISVTPHILERLALSAKHTELITNYPIIRDKSKQEDQQKDQRELQQAASESDSADPAICFAGGITAQWNHHHILTAIQAMGKVKYYLAGGGNEGYLEELKAHPAWEKVEYLGRITHKEVQEIYGKSRVGMALNYAKQIEGRGTLGNTKLFEYMEAELPILCSDYALWKELVEKHRCGISVNPADPEAIEQAMRTLLDNPEEAKAMGKRGRQAVLQEYNWKTQEDRLVALYEKVLE